MASPDAASWAVDHGYTSVYVFRGGLPEWVQTGYETVSLEKLPKFDTPTVTVTEVEKLLASRQQFVLLDLRPAMESVKMWIETDHRVVMPFEDIESHVGELPKGKKIVIVDATGKRSAIAGRYLALKGYEDVSRLDGGMTSWIAAGKPVKKGN